MKKEEYIDSVIKQIKNSRAKAEIKAELISHLEDRIEFYTDCGYSYDQACDKGIEKMGSTTQLAIQMDKLYSTKFNTALIVLLVLFYALTIVFFPLGVFAMLDLNAGISSLSVFKEIFIFISIITALAIARNRYWKPLALFQLVYFALYLFPISITNLGKIASPLVFLINCAVKSNLDDFNLILTSYCDIYFDSLIVTETYIFYLLFILFIIFNYLCIAKAVDNGADASVKKHKTASVVISLIFASLMIVLIFAYKPSSYQTYDKIIIYESDTKSSLDEIEEENQTVLDVNYDYSPYPYIECWDTDSPHITNDLELLKEFPDSPQDEYITADKMVNYNHIKYKCQTTSFKYVTDKKYIKVKMIESYDNEENSKETEWLDAENLVFEDSIQYGGLKSDYIHFETVNS